MARYVEYQREMAYRYFVTDAIYEDAEHMRIVPGARYYDRIHPRKVITKSGDEIAADVIKNAGLVVKA